MCKLIVSGVLGILAVLSLEAKAFRNKDLNDRSIRVKHVVSGLVDRGDSRREERRPRGRYGPDEHQGSDGFSRGGYSRGRSSSGGYSRGGF